MADMTMARLHEIMVVLYAVSLVFYFIDYLNKDTFAHRMRFLDFIRCLFSATVFLSDVYYRNEKVSDSDPL